MNLLECCHVLAESNISGSISQRCKIQGIGDCFFWVMSSNFETLSKTDIQTFKFDSLQSVYHRSWLPVLGRFHADFLKRHEDKNVCLLYHGRFIMGKTLTEICDRICSKVKL